MSAVFHWLYAFLFSPSGGGWAYPYLGLPGVEAFAVMLVLVPLMLRAFGEAQTRIETREWQTLVMLLMIALAAQLALRSLAPTTLAAVVESRGASGFLDVARTYGPLEFLSRFDDLLGELPMHVRANLPGKVLLFHVLLSITNSAAVMGVLIVMLSTLGGLMVYFLAREWFGDRRIALYALAFYLFMPARIFFMPVLNVVTPLFLLLPMCLLELHFRTRQKWPLLASGVAVYALVIFEPLPLVAGLIVIGQIVHRIHRGQITWRHAALVVLAATNGLILVHLAMRAFAGFDAVTAFLVALDDARRFNEANARPYGLWAFHNLKDFFLQMGVAQSLLAFVALTAVGRKRRWLAVSLGAVLLALTLLGINRGETVRLWIFLGVFLQIVAAQACVTRPGLLRVVLGAAIVQTAILISSIGWVTIEAAN